MSAAFNRDMLQLARELRGWTQAKLAAKAEISQGFISMMEHGEKDPSDERLSRIATALQLPKSFFSLPDDYLGFGMSMVFHRKRASARITHLRRLQAEMSLRRIHVSRLLRGSEVDAPNDFQTMDIDDCAGDAEQIAGYVRANWRVPLGPIANLIATIERAGGIVFKFSFGTKDIDAASQWAGDTPPLFFVNADAPADRARFSLAHELAHITMHQTASPEMEVEANRFASEFLMPAREIGPHLREMTIKRAASLKPYWRVAMQAIIRRARDLGKIPDSEYSRLFRRLSSLGYRKREPITISPEDPHLFRRELRSYEEANQCGPAEIATVLAIHEDEFRSMYLDPNPGLRLVSE